jgi:hypothetical protein
LPHLFHRKPAERGAHRPELQAQLRYGAEAPLSVWYFFHPKKRASKSPAGKTARLSAADWVDAALLTLGRRGVANVRIERLAKELKFTKRSF